MSLVMRFLLLTADYAGFSDVNQVLRNVKASFVQSPNTRKAWHEYQKQFGVLNPTKVYYILF